MHTYSFLLLTNYQRGGINLGHPDLLHKGDKAMKILLESITSMISGLSLITKDCIAINFAEIVHNLPIGAFMRNARIILSSAEGEEKYNKRLIQLEIVENTRRLDVCFSNKLNLKGKGKASTNLIKVEIEKGDEVLLMYGHHLLKKFTIREDYESKLNQI